jgi:anaerobic magnesium-protoporphyrin IX monomethyl ester cyclase
MKSWICSTLTSFLGPMQGPARLYAYIKKQGHAISLKDYNQDAYFTLLSKPYLEQTCERATFMLETLKRNKFLREDTGAILLNSSNQAIRQLLVSGIVMNRWEALKRMPPIIQKPILNLAGSKVKAENAFYAMLSQKEYVISEIEKARQILFDEFFNLPTSDFIRHFVTLLCGKALIDATFFPAQLDFGLGFHGSAYVPRVNDILRATTDDRHNFLIPYFRDRVIPELEAESPSVVGISITHVSEFIPAFTLARLIKSENPEIHICLGGASLTEVSHRIAKNLPLWDFFDSLVLGPGEQAFDQLIEKIETGRRLSEVPNLIYKTGSSIFESNKRWEFDLNDACTPEYESIRPRSILPLETSSGCYWGKCIFCYYPKEGRADFESECQKPKTRNIELVLDDIAKLRDRYAPIYIGITDSSLSPKRIEQIAENNLQSKNKVNFSAFFRFEQDFKSRIFCEKVVRGGFLGGQVGLESGSQRINNLINKGVDLKQAEDIIKNFRRCGILVHLYSIVGLPSETVEDARLTYEFIKRWHKGLTLGWQIYSIGILERGPLAARASHYGIKTVPLPSDYLIQAMQYQVAEGLSQAQSAALAIAYTEKLKPLMHPLNKIMDSESHKIILLAMKSYSTCKPIYAGTPEVKQTWPLVKPAVPMDAGQLTGARGRASQLGSKILPVKPK